MLLQAVDQIVQARVSDVQPWASRRLVTVVLPVVVLAAVRGLGPARDAAAALAAALRPAAERRVAAALVLLTIVLGAARVAPVFARPLQAGGGDLVQRVGAAIPASAYVLVAEPLGWTHLAAALWLGEGPTTLVARGQPWFPPALARFLDLPEMRDRPLYVLSGAVAGTTTIPIRSPWCRRCPPGCGSSASPRSPGRRRCSSRPSSGAPGRSCSATSTSPSIAPCPPTAERGRAARSHGDAAIAAGPGSVTTIEAPAATSCRVCVRSDVGQ